MRFVGAFRTEEIIGRPAADAAALARDYARCAEVTRRSSSNFYYAFMLLPVARRRALNAVYAFCRFVDDIADDESIGEPAVLLTRWREELRNVFAGAPTRPVSRALADNVARYNLSRRPFEEVIDGVEMDLTRRRYETFGQLVLYCRRVASAVGLICIEIFGYTNPSARTYAEQLGLAFQMTNILRDVREDAARGRIYLPLEDLRRFAVGEDEILRGEYSSRFHALMEFEADRAREFYRAAARALAREDRASMIAAEGMRLIYSALLDQIARADYRVLDRRLSLSAPRKLYLVGRAWAGARLPRAAG
ncbi:MAG: presqualene diphosphate synthase HpnD [Candidatus Binataceae bacterium]|nr:presqualene diphosphate synthase HpnD [Candidatus Binataceae bacterium]